MTWALKKQTGFTIVELLIVVVVIAILAAITIVAYTGIRERTNETALRSTLRQSTTWVAAQKASNGGILPTTITELSKGDGYTYDYETTNNQYCLSVERTGTSSIMHAGTAQNATQYAGPCPLAHWTLADSLSDFGMQGIHGTMSGNATLTQNQRGEANRAYAFDGNDYIDLTNSFWTSTFASSSDGFTISAWVRVPSYPPEQMPIIGQRYGDTMVVAMRSNGRIQLRMDDTGLGLQGNTSLNVNQWHHIAVTYSRSDSYNARYYLDGSPDGVVVTYDGSDIASSSLLFMGYQSRAGSGADAPFVGSLSDVSIYDRPLTENEIRSIYEGTK